MLVNYVAGQERNARNPSYIADPRARNYIYIYTFNMSPSAYTPLYCAPSSYIHTAAHRICIDIKNIIIRYFAIKKRVYICNNKFIVADAVRAWCCTIRIVYVYTRYIYIQSSFHPQGKKKRKIVMNHLNVVII